MKSLSKIKCANLHTNIHPIKLLISYISIICNPTIKKHKSLEINLLDLVTLKKTQSNEKTNRDFYFFHINLIFIV